MLRVLFLAKKQDGYSFAIAHLTVYVQGHVHKNSASVFYRSTTEILVAWMAWQYHKGYTLCPLI